MIRIYATAGARSQRVLWVCEELGVAYEVVELQFPPRLHHPEYLEKSAGGLIPMLEDGNLRLSESLAICEHLARQRASNLVVAPDEAGFTDYLQFLHFGESTLAPPLAWDRRLSRFSPEVEAEAMLAFDLRIKVVEQALSDGREFLAAGRLTLADISVAFALNLPTPHGINADLPPMTAAYNARLKARPAFRRAYGE